MSENCRNACKLIKLPGFLRTECTGEYEKNSIMVRSVWNGDPQEPYPTTPAAFEKDGANVNPDCPATLSSPKS